MAVIEAGAFHRRNFVATAFEKLAVGAVAGGVALTSSVYQTARYAEITIEGDPLRFTVDGTPPTAAIGHLVSVGDIIRLDANEDLVRFRAITTGAASVLCATYQELKLT